MESVVGETEGAASGVAHGEVLVALAETLVGRDDAALESARKAALAALGPEAFVDAVAVVSNFERMVRIADGTGIPLDAPMQLVTGDLREQLGIDRFAAAANTPAPGLLGRLAGRVAEPVASRAMGWVARLWAGAGR